MHITYHRDRPAGCFGLASDRGAGVEELAEETDLGDAGRDADHHGFVADRSDSFDAAGPGPAADPLEQIADRSELTLDRPTIQQLPCHRQHTNLRPILREGATAPDVFFRIGVTVVEVEDQCGGAGMFRDGDDGPLRRVTAGQHEAVRRRRAGADAERFGTLDLRRLRDERRRGRLARRWLALCADCV